MEQQIRPPQDPALTLELMLVAGAGMETVAANLLAEFGPEHAASALAMLAVTAPIEGVRGLAHLTTMGVPVGKVARRLEILNFSPWSLVASEKVAPRARRAIAEALGDARMVAAVSEHGLRVVDCQLEGLDDGLIIDGSLSLYRVTGLVAIPDRMVVEKNLDIWSCPDLRHIGDQLVVNKLMHVRECPLSAESWPQECNIAELDLPGQPRAPFRREPRRKTR